MVHFPIAFLLAAPLFLLVSLFTKDVWKTWVGAALVLMVLGTAAAWLAVASGHAAGQLVDKTPLLEREIGRHEALGVDTRNLFTALLGAFAVLLLLPAAIRRALPRPARIALHAVFLVVYLGGTVVLGRTASQGGRLVHEFGIQAMIEKPRVPAVEARAGAVGPAGATAAREEVKSP
jgi:uncharacterized membrane protein